MLNSRELWIIPILHNEADLGSLSTRISAKRASNSTALIEDLWRQLEAEVLALPVDPANLLLYQDSLPDCGLEASLLRQLASQGSANFKLLEKLVARGAKLIGTESLPLLLREYHLACRPEDALSGELPRLIEARDRYIAQRIDATMGAAQMGLLFIGMLHDVARFLPADIAVRYPLRITP